MALPASGAISMSQVATEIGVSQTGLSMNHAWIRALANEFSGAVDMNSLHGQVGTLTGNYAITGGPSGLITVNAGFIHGTLGSVGQNQFGFMTLSFNGNGISYTGNIKVTNNTSATSGVLSWVNSTTWQATVSTFVMQARIGDTDNFTFTFSN